MYCVSMLLTLMSIACRNSYSVHHVLYSYGMVLLLVFFHNSDVHSNIVFLQMSNPPPLLSSALPCTPLLCPLWLSPSLSLSLPNSLSAPLLSLPLSLAHTHTHSHAVIPLFHSLSFPLHLFRLWFVDVVLPVPVRPSVYGPQRPRLQVNHLPTRWITD